MHGAGAQPGSDGSTTAATCCTHSLAVMAAPQLQLEQPELACCEAGDARQGTEHGRLLQRSTNITWAAQQGRQQGHQRQLLHPLQARPLSCPPPPPLWACSARTAASCTLRAPRGWSRCWRRPRCRCACLLPWSLLLPAARRLHVLHRHGPWSRCRLAPLQLPADADAASIRPAVGKRCQAVLPGPRALRQASPGD
jgi:hypothetical protein